MGLLKGGLLLYREIATGSIDGTNTTFTSSFAFIPGTLIVLLNGIEQESPEDYVEIDNHTIEFVDPPIGGTAPDKVVFRYQRA